MSYKIAFSSMVLPAKIPPGDPIWAKFNASFENMDLEPVQILDLIYTGHPFTAQHKDHWRTSANYLMSQYIGIDFDTEDERSTLSKLGKDPFIHKYANLIYTTPSHRPEAPRARVLFLLDTPIHQAKNYTLAASSLLWLFGAADRQCKDAARFFYGSIDCDMEWYGDNVLPLAKVKEMIQQYQTTGQAARKAHETKFTPTADQEEVAAALRRIPAWGIDYDEWVQVLMALHAAYGDSALSMAESWADGTPGEVSRKWRTFKASGNGTGAVTPATVFAIAKRFGWMKGI